MFVGLGIRFFAGLSLFVVNSRSFSRNTGFGGEGIKTKNITSSATSNWEPLSVHGIIQDGRAQSQSVTEHSPNHSTISSPLQMHSTELTVKLIEKKPCLFRLSMVLK